ncbi:hypothetical protein ASPWEDRAFT_38680 [Aspergillus wentii DTO 134E9]|uniref:Uncharacterized protein n=1 Tax=Aspergillus wentii DTO 134E9 TaxID=1073089 RepID=A0A1L9RQ41_ASPWE|nr:uncharacterized protein ASPWEDRAFT_38680 [Aspergillus wentii DTO 134E9]OJJ37044.1 hypothetical protein ASPWEDRAFT_38680 [Aspergillus wentii DTO 134E9]
MESTPNTDSRTLKVDFSWKKFKTLITELNNPNPDPLYIVDWQSIKKPHLIFKSAQNDSTIGTSTFHTFSINTDYEVHGKKGILEAQRRFKTHYTYDSYAFSDTDSPVTMTWTSNCGLKTWNFVCVDEQQMPVARFSANVWAVRKMGNIEFMGERAYSDAVRDEIVVTGLSLFFCMLIRSNNILSFFGAVFSRPGHDKEAKVESDQKEHMM